jgi:hypothetical protein
MRKLYPYPMDHEASSFAGIPHWLAWILYNYGHAAQSNPLRLLRVVLHGLSFAYSRREAQKIGVSLVLAHIISRLDSGQSRESRGVIRVGKGRRLWSRKNYSSNERIG